MNLLRTHLIALIAAAAILVPAARSNAQVYTADWNTIDCGGGALGGGTYALNGTIAQPDATARVALSGGTFTITGGFWAGAPCPADFNGDGVATVSDIFDFLAAWFAADPRADFNTVNGIGVADIFDFLAAWFSGC